MKATLAALAMLTMATVLVQPGRTHAAHDGT